MDIPTTHRYRTVVLDKPDPLVHAGYYYEWSILGYSRLFTGYWMSAIIIDGHVLQEIEHLEQYGYPHSHPTGFCALQRQKSIEAILSFINHVSIPKRCHFRFRCC